MNKMIAMGLWGGSVTIKYPTSGWYKVWLMKRINDTYQTGLTWAKNWFETCDGTLHLSPEIVDRLIRTVDLEITLTEPAAMHAHAAETRDWSKGNVEHLYKIRECLKGGTNG